MAVELVEIVNPSTGRKGIVASTSSAAATYKRPPSARQEGIEPSLPGGVIDPRLGNEPESLDAPAKNASTEAWVAYATDPATPNGLSSDEASQMSRDELVAHFDQVQED